MQTGLDGRSRGAPSPPRFDAAVAAGDRASGVVSIRLFGPDLEVTYRDGGQDVVGPSDASHPELWNRLPADEQEWHPSWGFRPDDDPDSYPPNAVF